MDGSVTWRGGGRGANRGRKLVEGSFAVWDRAENFVRAFFLKLRELEKERESA